jgi:hypothetical protein
VSEQDERTKNLVEAFELLRSLCDPRGYGVLQALEALCLSEGIALDTFLQADPEPMPSNVVPMIARYSMKVPS